MARAAAPYHLWTVQGGGCVDPFTIRHRCGQPVEGSATIKTIWRREIVSNRKKHKFRKEEIRFFSLTIFHSEPGHRTLQYEIKTRLILNAHCTRGIWTGATVAFTWRLWRATALTWKKSEETNGHNGEWKNKFSKDGEQMKQKLARKDRLLYSVHEKV